MMTLCVAQTIWAAQAEVELQGISGARFGPHTTIWVPHTPCNEVIVRVPDPSSLLKGVLRMKLCDRPTPPSMDRSGSTEVLRAFSGEPTGHFGIGEECTLKITAAKEGTGFSPLEWKIIPWDYAYVVAKQSVPQAPAPSVRIDDPPGGAFNSPTRQKSATVRGAVLNSGDFKVKIAGNEVERDPTRGGWAFEREVNLEPDVREVEVDVEDPRGSTTRLLMPVVR